MAVKIMYVKNPPEGLSASVKYRVAGIEDTRSTVPSDVTRTMVVETSPGVWRTISHTGPCADYLLEGDDGGIEDPTTSY